MKRHLLLILAVALLSNINAQNIKIDSTFGENGIVAENFQNGFKVPLKAVEFTDDSYLIYNIFEDTNRSGGELRKYKKSGELDESFANGGIYTLDFNYDFIVADFVVLDDNKIAITDFSQDTCNVHVLDKDGTLINKFKLKFRLKDITPSQIEYLNGFLYISGLFSDGETENTSFIIKTDLEGNTDESFADNGIFKHKGEYEDNGNYFLLQDNKLLLLHSSFNSNKNLTSNMIIRLNTDGEIDTSFGYNGIASFGSEVSDWVNSVLLDSELNIYVVPFEYPIVFKLDKDGSIDKSYGQGGAAYKFAVNENNKAGSYFGTIHNDEIYLFGDRYANKDEEKLVGSIFSYDKNGQPNNSFGEKGIYSMDTEEKNSIFISGFFDKNDRLLVMGNYIELDDEDNRDYVLIRFTQKPNGTSEINSDIENISVYPNPIQNNTINLQVKGQNQLLLKYHSELSNGTYLLKIASDKGVSTKKITVAK